MKKPETPAASETNAPKPEATTIDYLKSGRDIAFIVAIFLYYAGWIYIYFYLGKFGIPLKSVDFDIYNLLIFSSNVFIYLYNTGKVYLMIILLLIIGLTYWNRASIIMRKAIPVCVVLLFPLIFYIAKSAAEFDAYNAIFKPGTYLNSIQFVFKDLKVDLPAGIKGPKNNLAFKNIENKKLMVKLDTLDRFKLVALSKDEYFVLQTNKDTLTKDDMTSYVPIIFGIKKETVEFVRITK